MRLLCALRWCCEHAMCSSAATLVMVSTFDLTCTGVVPHGVRSIEGVEDL